MCGIAGFFSTSPRSNDMVSAMLAALKKRGPDAQHAISWDADFRRTDNAPQHALLHTRLSIIDPRPEADQPMGNEAGDIWICYNGEVYGWADEAASLKDRGAAFRTHSDTEFILRGYETWGIEALLPKLRGMFAFALLDLRQRKLFLIRDRLGLKPLVYSHSEDGIAFGSLVRSVLPFLPAAQRGFDPDALDAYLAHRYIPAPMTVFSHIRRLENGHLLEYDLDNRTLEKRRYWSPQPASGDWQKTLDEAIELRTVADRPLGVFLSGGVDSSLIACRLAAQGHASLQTFTAAFPGSKMDESEDAAAFAGVMGFPNHPVPIPMHIAEDFPRIVADLDEPFADPSCFPSWYLARATSETVKVVLGGDGGDELFAGYKRLARHVKTAWRSGLRLPLPVMPSTAGKGMGKWMAELSLDWEAAYALRFSGCTPGQRAYLQPSRRPKRAVWWRTPDTEETVPVKKLLAWDYANYLPEYILRKADLMTMSHGLELRAPLLDHRFVEVVFALPDSERFTHPAKQLLAQACPALEPVLRRKKRGFNPPLTGWLHEDLAGRLEGLGSRLQNLTGGQLDAGAVNALVAHYHKEESLAEQVLQLLILDESLTQLRTLSKGK